MPTAIVRPSGVWNTRAPLHTFLCQTIQLQQDYGLLTGAISRTRYDAEHLPEGATSSASRFMHARYSGPVASKAWNAYRWSWRALHGKPEAQPAITDVEKDLAICLYAVREYAIVRFSAVYESFVQAWALNLLLALQEAGKPLTEEQASLAALFSPVGKDYVVTPGVPKILRAFPNVRDQLLSLPHISTDPKTKEPVEVPSTPLLNALRTISFWRDFRNHVVHRGGRISTGFARSHWEFFEAFRQSYGELLRPLQHGRLLQTPDALYYALAGTHRKAAIFLNDHLRDASAGRRGTIYAPEERKAEPTQFEPQSQTRPLLRPGDHPESLNFVDQFNYVPERDDPDEDA